MNNTLSNWTLHGQNLGNMLRNYRQQYRHLRADQWKELGHFFNMASNVLDTIGSMTENAILRSVKYDDNDGGGGGEGIRRRGKIMGGGFNNKPPIELPPTDTNLSQYSAMFPSYQMDNRNILQPNPTFGDAIFSDDYSPHPNAIKLRINPNLPPYDKEYSTDDNSSTDNSLLFDSSSDNGEEDNDEKQHNSDESYV